ncbi:HK97 family phage prohead protease [Streptomyces sp. NBRC 109706]|uniref:HK97 family phage prohead protease n=1 Tax=Streptomyces sp. NBRC 109706 TaxID=1550035 RepID=UPI000784C19B|nr:HK97 family phage prohead protease [Streptomyces sp. NBRC 109706]
MDTKTLRGVEIKNEDRGEVTAVFATLGVTDHDGDVTREGAFTDGAKVAISAYGHASWGAALPAGKGVIHVRGDEAVLDGQFFLATAHGRDTFETVKALAEDGLGEWSYGFDIDEYAFGEHDGRHVRFLDRVTVHEVSPVLLGAGVNTRTLAAKSRNQTFAEEGDAVLAAVTAYGERAADVLAMRLSKGKALGGDSRALLAKVRAELARLDGLLDQAEPETSDEAALADVQREWLRAVARGL